MRNLLALGAAFLIGFAGIGWYLGWYTFATTPTPTGRHISIDLNTPKIQEDVSRGKEKVRDFLSSDDNTPHTTQSPQSPNQPLPPVTPAGFQPTSDGGPTLPNSNDPVAPFAPVPPNGNSPRLPTPR